MKIKFWILIMGLWGLSETASGQITNTPNKVGPMGLLVNTYSGNLFLSRNDLLVPSRELALSVTFHYNSFNYDVDAGFGRGWSINYNIRYSNDTAGGKRIVWGDGREDLYRSISGAAFQTPRGRYNTLSEYQPGKLLLTEKDGTKMYFDNNVNRKLTRIEDANGNFVNLAYNDSLLISVTNAAGQVFNFNYDVNGRLSSVVDAIATPARVYTYVYDGAGNLIEVTDPLGAKYKYAYLVNGPLRSVTDKNSNKTDVIYFNDFTVSEIVGCNRRISFSYDEASLSSYVTEHLSSGTNQVEKYQFKKFEEQTWLIKISSNCCGYSMSFDYDALGNVIRQTDANGNSTQYTYDARGNILAVTDPLNNTSTYTYSSDFNQTLTVTDTKGNVSEMQYDSRGNMIKFIEPGSAITSFTYNSTGDVLTVTNPNGYVTSFTYDSRGYQTSVTAPSGFQMNLQNDARGNVTSITDPRGFVYTKEYDALNRIRKITNPQGKTIEYTYDAQGNIISAVNELGYKKYFSYDASNRLVKMTNAVGIDRNVSYDELGNIIQFKDALGRKMEMKYDARNRLVSSMDPIGNITSFTYDANGNLLSASLPSGRVISNTYDAMNRLLNSSDGIGLMGAFSYDKNGNIISVTNVSGAKFTFSYDARNRTKTATDPLGNTRTYQYDASSNITSITLRNGNAISYGYDSLDRLVSNTDELGNLTKMSYDASGNMISVEDANNHVTAYSYDNLNRLSKVTFPDNRFIQFVRDHGGNIISRTQPDGSVITYQYDSLNRLKGKILPGNDVYSYGYDIVDRMVSAVNSNATVTLTYDILNRLVAENVNGKITSYSYDPSGTAIDLTYPDGTILTHNFDPRYRLVQLTKGNSPVVGYTYNASNQLTSAVYGNTVSSVYQYDFANRLNLLSTGAGTIQHSAFSYDKELNIASVEKLNNPFASEQYGYDASSRMINYRKGPLGGTPSLQHVYNYDAVGNRISAAVNAVNTNYTSNALNQLATSNGGTGNVNFLFDNNGNLSYDGQFYKFYDAEGRLLKDSASPSNKVLYSYDAFGRRYRKMSQTSDVRYVYDGLTQIEQRDANADTVINKMFYAGLNSPVMMQKGQAKFYYHNNQLGSVEAISTDNARLLEKYEYDPYGKMNIYDSVNNNIASSVSGNRFGFTGQEYDNETGNVAFHFRNYSPSTGTFNQRDPIGYADGMGMYQYVSDNPSTNKDQLGLEGGPFSSVGQDPLQDILNFLNNGNTIAGDELERSKYLEKAKEALDAQKGKIDKLDDAIKKTRDVYDRMISKGKNKIAKELMDKINKLNMEKGLIDLSYTSKLARYENLLRLGKYAGPLLNAIDLYYKVWKAREPKRDACGNIIPRTDFEQARLNLDVMLSGFSFSPHGALYSLFDWGVELGTGKSYTTWMMDAGEAHYNWMDKHPNLAAAENLCPLVAATNGLGYLEGRYQVSEKVNDFITYPAYLLGTWGW